MNTISRNHTNIKEFVFNRRTGANANSKIGSEAKTHTVINPHYKRNT
jgi:hypothetical protein